MKITSVAEVRARYPRWRFRGVTVHGSDGSVVAYLLAADRMPSPVVWVMALLRYDITPEVSLAVMGELCMEAWEELLWQVEEHERGDK